MDRILTCIRSQRALVEQDLAFSIARLYKLVNISDVFKLKESEPYGLAFDPGTSRLWLADKGLGQIHEIGVSRERDGLAFSYRTALKCPQMHAPCSLSWNPVFGLLVADYGTPQFKGNLLLHDGNWRELTPGFQDRITHCCWSNDKGAYYLTRSDSVLWRLHPDLTTHKPLSTPSLFVAPPRSGSVSQLTLRYVQGLQFTSAGTVLIADANLGAVFEVNPATWMYSVVAGSPTVADSTFINKKYHRPDEWLGPIRALLECDKNKIAWLNGVDSSVTIFDRQSSTMRTLRIPEVSKPASGAGMILL